MKPVLLIVDDDPQVLQAVGIDLRHKYGDRFRLLKADSGTTALDILKQLKLRNEPAIRSINKAKVDFYLMKPWDPPEQNLFPVIDDLLDD